MLTVVESPRVPFRYAPGLSLNAPAEPPPQLGVFVDGDGPSALVRYDGRQEPLAYLDYLTSALPYHLLARPRVLVLGAGAGADVLQAIALGARAVDAVELDPLVIDLVQRQFGDYSGRPYSLPGVRVHIGEARGFVARHQERFDLIEVALLDAFAASSAGLYALSESYLYTIEGMAAYLDRLEPGGMLAITRWVSLPPRDVLKLFATATVALERRGVAEPGRRLALIRSWKTATLIVKNGAFTAGEVASLEAFCRARSFDADYYPGIAQDHANQYNILDDSYFYDGAMALLGPDRKAFVDHYKFVIAPATDDRPHFFHFFRWSTLPELLALKEQGGLPLFEWGYPVLIATLLQAIIASLMLVVVPHVAWPRWHPRRRRCASAARRSGGRLFHGNRLRIHVHRDRVYPEVPPVPRAPALRRGSRAVCVPGVWRTGEPLFAALRRGKAMGGPSTGVANCRHCRHCAPLSSFAAGDLPAPDATSRSRADRNLDCADCPARICNGDAVSAGSRSSRRPRRRADSMGLGN